MELDSIRSFIAAAGLAFRGAFHPDLEDAPPILPNGVSPGTLVLVGFTGNGQWSAFAASPEASDGRPDPLDRWSRRTVSDLARRVCATPLFPFCGPPFLPFQLWALKAEPVHPSPLGILIHPDWGLWHSYRGALAFRERLTIPQKDPHPSPCDTCSGKPCLAACPVGAFGSAGYDVPACIGHISGHHGADCMTSGCMARRACPVGGIHRYGNHQAGFYMQAFLRANR
jgi:hypothetical protein